GLGVGGIGGELEDTVAAELGLVAPIMVGLHQAAKELPRLLVAVGLGVEEAPEVELGESGAGELVGGLVAERLGQHLDGVAEGVLGFIRGLLDAALEADELLLLLERKP